MTSLLALSQPLFPLLVAVQWVLATNINVGLGPERVQRKRSSSWQ
jgi:hypothetical protein